MLIIKQQLVKAIKKYLMIEVLPQELTRPPKVDLGDWTWPCFSLAKEKKQSPIKVAQELAQSLNKVNDIWDKVEASGPYINFYLKDKYWNRLVLSQSGRAPIFPAEKIMIEYSQPNTHKEFHVGHLRNACLGSSLVNLYRFVGQEVISANYIGDIGMHVAKCLWGLKNLPEFKNKINSNELNSADLAMAYTQVCQRESVMKEDPSQSEKLMDFYHEVAEIYREIEDDKSAIHRLWGKTKKISMHDFHRIYAELNIEFDEWFWESVEEKNGKTLLNSLLKSKKIKYLKESQGAVIADLKDFGLDVLVLIKSDGNSLYGAKDLPLGKKKFDEFGVDKSIYVVDNRQQLYLKQIFKLLDLFGYEKQTKIHVSYDFVTLAEGAMASRKGNVVTYDSLMEQVKKKVKEETEKRHSDWSTEKVAQTAEKIAFAAIKFFMLKYDNNSVIVFDIDKATALDGASGPYLLYVLARINSILTKMSWLYNLGPVKYELLNSPEEKELIALLSRFEEVVELAVVKQQPSFVANYLLELAQNFNSFYHEHSVLRSSWPIRRARYKLLLAIKKTMELGLQLLNISGLREM